MDLSSKLMLPGLVKKPLKGDTLQWHQGINVLRPRSPLTWKNCRKHPIIAQHVLGGIRLARAKGSSNGNSANGGANLGFEAVLWKAADKLRSNMDAAEYKHVVLGLIFLKYISDAFDSRHEELVAMESEGADPEDRDEYISEGVFWVPRDARWEFIRSKAKLPEIGRFIDDALISIEKENPPLKGVLPKEYARPTLDKTKLGELVDLISAIGFREDEDRSRDILGRVFEYFLGQFASAEGKKGGQFYTPRCVVRLLVEMMEPYKGRVYDPCCGSAGMFVQSDDFIKAHGGKRNDISVFGQESNPTTWRLSRMNLAIRGIEGNLGPKERRHLPQRLPQGPQGRFHHRQSPI